MGKYPYWQIAKWNRERAQNETSWKQMKDRDMKGCILWFVTQKIQNSDYYYLRRIADPTNKITYDYVANLGGKKKMAPSEFSYHGYGGYVKYVTLCSEEFVRMKNEVERLNGEIKLFYSDEEYYDNYYKYCEQIKEE